MKRSVPLPVLIHVIIYLLQLNNLKPKFWSVEELGEVLAGYFLGLSLRRFRVPRSTVHYYWRRATRVTLNLPLTGEYAVDEAKVLLAKEVMYYLWVLRDVHTGYHVLYGH